MGSNGTAVATMRQKNRSPTTNRVSTHESVEVGPVTAPARAKHRCELLAVNFLLPEHTGPVHVSDLLDDLAARGCPARCAAIIATSSTKP